MHFLILLISGHVRFIDYEYSSYNYQAFDIGNHFNEFAGLQNHCDLLKKLIKINTKKKETQV